MSFIHYAGLFENHHELNLFENHLDLMNILLGTLPLKTEEVFIGGRDVAMPRLISWHGEKPYRYSGKLFQPNPWTPELLEIKSIVESHKALGGTKFNSVLVNFYRNGKDSISWHSDDEPEIDGHCIVSVSFGAERRFKVRHKTTKEVVNFNLGGGDMFVMIDAQKDWEHCVPKTTKEVGPRMNLTFRRMK